MAASPTDTIFAVSSGAPPAAIAVLRISGSGAMAAAKRLAGTLPPPRHAGLRRLRNAHGEALDDALVLLFPAPNTATGEDIAELHLHGGRAIVAVVETELAALPGLRRAEPGEFTRRSLAWGRIDLSQAEGLADLLAAETEMQRRLALAAAEGAVGARVRGWNGAILELAARAEALIDFADEDDVAADDAAVAALREDIGTIAGELERVLADPPVERVRDGLRVVLAGPPNAGKSSLLNALAGRAVSIATPIAGTTRDRIEAPVVRDGITYVLTDTAGLVSSTVDPIESIGVDLAHAAIAEADILLWLGDGDAPSGALPVHARADLPGRDSVPDGSLAVSIVTGAGLADLWNAISVAAAKLLPTDRIGFNRRQREQVARAEKSLAAARDCVDPLLIAEDLRLARGAFDAITGAAHTEQMLDALFKRFCVGK